MAAERKTENSRTLQARQSKNRIIRGFFELARERGSDNVTVAELCSYLGISVGQFYHHFRSKEELYYSVYYILDAQLDEWSVQSQETDPKQKLLQYTVWFAMHNESMGVEFVKKLFSGSNTNLSVKKKNMQYIEKYCDEFRREYHLEEYYTLEELIRHLRVAYRGVIFDWAIHDGSYNVEEAMRAEISSVLDGILQTRPGKRLFYEGCPYI